MKLELQDFAVTIASGLFFVVGAWCVFRILLGVDLLKLVALRSWSRSEDNDPENSDTLKAWLPAAALSTVAAFAAGLMLDAYSDYAVQPKDAGLVLDAYLNHEVEPEEGTEEDYEKHDRTEEEELTPSHLSPYWPFLISNEKHVGFEVYDKTFDNLFDDDDKGNAQALYFEGKNKSLKVDGYAEILKKIQHRIDFSRSLWLACAVLFWLTAVLVVLRFTLFVSRFILTAIPETPRTNITKLFDLSVESDDTQLIVLFGRGLRASAFFFVLLAFFFALAWAAATVFAHESEEYNKHAYGFLVTLKAEDQDAEKQREKLSVRRNGQKKELAYRSLLFPETADRMSEPLKEIVARLCNPRQKIVEGPLLKTESDYYVRLVPKKFVISQDGKLSEEAMLGSNPFVFITMPDGLYGKELEDVFLDMGYEAEDILSEKILDQEYVAIVFRYPPEVEVCDDVTGSLPQETKEWTRRVYTPTWPVVFALLEKLVKETEIVPDELPAKKWIITDDDRVAARLDDKEVIENSSYACLRAKGEADALWKYRSLLERKLSCFEHFRGTGRAQNEVKDPDNKHCKIGLIERVGPNWLLQDLAEVAELAVIDVGSLRVSTQYRNKK